MTRDFFVRQGDLTQEYFVYFKENQRSMTEKAPSRRGFNPIGTGSKSYKIIRELNSELREQGICVISGRVNRRWFDQRFGLTDRPAKSGRRSRTGV